MDDLLQPLGSHGRFITAFHTQMDDLLQPFIVIMDDLLQPFIKFIKKNIIFVLSEMIILF